MYLPPISNAFRHDIESITSGVHMDRLLLSENMSSMWSNWDVTTRSGLDSVVTIAPDKEIA